MLLEQCFSMRPLDDTAGEKGMVNQMLLGRCLCMTPQDARGERVSMKCSCIYAVVCRSMTLHDERGKVLSKCS